ncbi:DUF2911 domain-containing protein [Aridibaculum aurantiacum]|uniref:DUF2911 domain-containing protein n=1 Tax=Aridibaculum aurantiacum TaxID=2810307 RepID=UPI001A96D29F|nr:DUF2911 domain-containing protein [Aridibaculum aurantiacum]
MKKVFVLALAAALPAVFLSANAQDDKSKRASPPAVASATLPGGAVVTINYSQPSVKGRTIGKDIAAYGKVWRTGANEATTFETTKDLKVSGQTLPAGKYSIYTIPGEDEWTVIFNKIWNQWGTRYNEQEDALRLKVKPASADHVEQLTFDVDKEGVVKLRWANTLVNFNLE